MEPTYFVWNLEREIIHLAGPFGIRWYSLLFMFGFVVGFAMFTSMLKKESRPLEVRDPLLYYIVVGTIVGARLGHCLFYDPIYYLQNPLEIFKIWTGGLASHGGFTGVVLSLFFFSRKFKDFSFLWLADRISIASVMAGGFIRLGNLFNSEVVGKVTDVPWAFIFAKVDELPRHPTQIYESMGYMIISLILFGVYHLAKGRPLPGRIIGLALLIAYGFRAFIEIFKENQMPFESGLPFGFNMGQYLSFPFMALGLFLSLGLHRRFLKPESYQEGV